MVLVDHSSESAKRQTEGKLCLYPRVSGFSGMASFQLLFARQLQARGWAVTFDPLEENLAGVLVTGGSRQVGLLRQARRRGIPVIQRLDGINWIHRHRRTGLRHYLRAEYGNFVLAYLRRSVASGVIYQSEFTRGWWERVYGPMPGKGGGTAKTSVIYNGVDLDLYSPAPRMDGEPGRLRLQLVEGNLGGGYEQGLETAVHLARELQKRLAAQPVAGFSSVELRVAGKTDQQTRQRAEDKFGGKILWQGAVEREKIPQINRQADLFYSADLNPACPNAVLEALACGTPVIAFDTGALPEIVTGKAGRLAAYGGDPWKLDPPDISALASQALAILPELPEYQTGARQRAEACFGAGKMTDDYLAFILG